MNHDEVIEYLMTHEHEIEPNQTRFIDGWVRVMVA